MHDSDGQLKPIPVAEFEGEFVRNFEGKLPAIVLDMPEGYQRGMHLVMEVEVRVRNVGYIEDKKQDLTRQHIFALEEVRLKEAFDPAHRPTNVGGSSAGDAWEDRLLAFFAGETDDLDFEGEEIPERLRALLEMAFQTPVQNSETATDPWRQPDELQLELPAAAATVEEGVGF